METEKCTPIDDSPAFRVPKKDWDFLLKEGFLNEKQMRFLKRAEKLGFYVHFGTKFHEIGVTRRDGVWAVSEITLSKTFQNKI